MAAIVSAGEPWATLCAVIAQGILRIDGLPALPPTPHGSRDNTWRLYNGLVQTSGAQAPATVAHADVTVGVLSGPDGAMLIATNHGSAPIAAPLRFAGAVFDVTCIPMPGARFEHGSDTTLQLDAHAVGIVTWRSPWQPTPIPRSMQPARTPVAKTFDEVLTAAEVAKLIGTVRVRLAALASAAASGCALATRGRGAGCLFLASRAGSPQS